MKCSIKRFNKVECCAHWANAVFFGLLFLSGMVLFLGTIAAAIGHEGVAFTKIVHRVAAIPFILTVPVLLIFGTPKTTKTWLKSIFTWSKNDLIWLSRFAKEFFGGRAELPPQGKLNAGEKINSLLCVFGCGLLTISGLIMWLSSPFSSNLVLIAYAVHDMAAATVGAAVIGHSFLGLFHPEYKEALNGIIHGTVSEEFAKGHHGQWYEELAKSEETASQKSGITI